MSKKLKKVEELGTQQEIRKRGEQKSELFLNGESSWSQAWVIQKDKKRGID